MIKQVYYRDKIFYVKFLSGIKRYIGLRFYRKLKLNQGVMLVNNSEMISNIDMFFVFFPIKVIWLNSNKQVVDVKIAKPFQPLITSNKKAQYLLELNKNVNVDIGEKLKF